MLLLPWWPRWALCTMVVGLLELKAWMLGGCDSASVIGWSCALAQGKLYQHKHKPAVALPHGL